MVGLYAGLSWALQIRLPALGSHNFHINFISTGRKLIKLNSAIGIIMTVVTINNIINSLGFVYELVEHWRLTLIEYDVICNITVDTISEVARNLGVYIDRILDFKSHVINRCSSSYGKFSVTRRFKNSLPMHTKET